MLINELVHGWLWQLKLGRLCWAGCSA